MNITKIDKDSARQIRSELDAALAAWGFGLKAQTLGATYDPGAGTITFKVQFSLPDATRRQFETYCGLFGLKPEHFGATFRAKLGTATITGLDMRKRAYPVLATVGGKTFGFRAEAVVKALAHA